MDISIIIPVYNEEKNIDLLFKNLNKIEFKNGRFEILMIDDGSTDKTKDKIFEKIKDTTNIRYFYKKNGGVASARNLGILKAKGKYICFLDADDEYTPDFIKKMYSKIVETASDGCYCGYIIKTPNDEVRKKTRFIEENLLENYILGNVKIHTDSWLIEKNFLINHNIWFPEEFQWGEDFYFFCLFLSNQPKISVVSEFLTFYYKGFDANRLSREDNLKIDVDISVLNKLLQEKTIKDNKQAYLLIKKYRIPSTIINRILMSNGRDVKFLYGKYKNYINDTYLSFKVRIVRLHLRKLYLKGLVYLKRSSNNV